MIGRRIVAAGVVAGAVAVGGVAGAMIGIPGLSGATTTSGASGPSGSTTAPADEAPDGGPHFHMHVRDDGVFAAAAEALNLSTEELMQKLSDGKTTIADVAEQQNVDVQTVIDAMEAVSNKRIEDLVNNPLPTPSHDWRGGPGRGGHDGFGFGFGFPGLRGGFDSLAKALGVTTDELRNDLRDGKSIADIAKANNVDLDTVADALVKEATDRLDQAVKDEKLTQEQADKIESGLKQTITDLLNGKMPELPGGMGHPGFGGGFRMHGDGPNGPWPGSPEDAPDQASPSSAAACAPAG
jgi:hypothetical protein